MFFKKKYHIVIFKDATGSSRKIRLAGWAGIIIILLVVAAVAGNLYLWTNFARFKLSEKRLHQAEKTVHDQNLQILNFAARIKDIEKDLSRVRDFDSKLRVMVNLEQARNAPQGGADNRNFSEGYLPLYRQELMAKKMHAFIEQLATDTRLETVRQDEIFQAVNAKSDVLAATPAIWPVEGFVASGFGYRTSPFTGQREFHKGMDIGGPVGTMVVAPARARVMFIGNDSSYGLVLVLDHGFGLTTSYGHLHTALVKQGQVVARGEPIAQIGDSGRTTGPHLHYEVAVSGVPVNPARYILN